MSMFDYVYVTVKCPNCGEDVDGFQTKEAGCTMEHLHWSEVNYCYTACEHCDCWIELTLNDLGREIKREFLKNLDLDRHYTVECKNLQGDPPDVHEQQLFNM